MTATRQLKTAKPPKATAQELSLAQITDDADLQPRKTLDLDILREYSIAWLDGAKFPPITVFFDGETYWLADGFYRVRSARKANLHSIRALVYDGDKRDAKLFSVGANAEHGMRRTNEDKRLAVLKLLDDPEWCLWSDAEIARACKVSGGLVLKYRQGSPGVRGHDVAMRISSDGSIHTTNDFKGKAVESSGVAPETFHRPPVMMTKGEIEDKFTRRIVRHLKKSDPDLQTDVAYEHGTLDIVAKDRLYCFAIVVDKHALYALVGKMLVARACIDVKAGVTIIGNFPKTVAPLIATLGARLNVQCQTPEQILAD